MKNLSGFPCVEVEFDKQGKIFDASALQEAVALVSDNAISDLFVISHGWNNDMSEARRLYKDFFSRVRQVLDGDASLAGARKFAILAVLWPSKKFADKQLIASGAASGSSPVTDAVLRKQLDDLKGVFDNPKANTILAAAKKLVPQLEKSTAAQARFADLVRSLPKNRKGGSEDASDGFFKLKGGDVMKRLSRPVPGPRPKLSAKGGAAGGAAGIGAPGGAASIGGIFSGIRSAARNILNFTTYYQMKERAGIVGSSGVADAIRKIRAKSPGVKIHLIGHSFGGRLVTAAALGQAGKPPQIMASMTLLQAAFSHNGFAGNFQGKPGFFRGVIDSKKVTGPVLITCTSNDEAVGVAYPLASLIAGQNAAKLGDANDPFGGIGANGAQNTVEAVPGVLGAVGTAYSFTGGKLYNLTADKFINDHSDICKPEVAYALLKAVART